MITGEGTVEPVFHQPAPVRRERARTVSGIRVRPAGAPEALAHADAEGEGALHPHEDLPRGRERGAQAGRLPVQDRPGEAHAHRQLRRRHQPAGDHVLRG